METLKQRRTQRGFSQRGIAEHAGVSFRTIQLLEGTDHNVRLSTLNAVAHSLGYPAHVIEHAIDAIFSQPPESVAMTSERMATGKEDWRIPFFEFVDAFRAKPDMNFVAPPPSPRLTAQLTTLLASSVECICHEAGYTPPSWCATVPPLSTPWFVAATENLKATALVESPVWFRQRNIFVLNNFLERK